MQAAGAYGATQRLMAPLHSDTVVHTHMHTHSASKRAAVTLTGAEGMEDGHLDVHCC